MEIIYEIREGIHKSFDSVDKVSLSYLLGIEISQEGKEGSISINYWKTIEKLLEDHKIDDSKIDSGTIVMKCSSEDCQRIDRTKYQSLIGLLLYMVLETKFQVTCSMLNTEQNKHGDVKLEVFLIL